MIWPDLNDLDAATVAASRNAAEAIGIATATYVALGATNARLDALEARLAALEAPSPAGFVLGQTKPDASNTGLTGPTTTTSTGGTLYVDAGGTADAPLIIRDTRFERRVVVRAPYITFVNCDIPGPSTMGTVSSHPVECGHPNAHHVRFERCRIRPTAYRYDRCILGNNFTLYRCDLSHATDCVTITGPASGPANIVLEGCYLHDMAFKSGVGTDGRPDGVTHNDCVQFSASSNAYSGVRIFGCTLVDSIDPTWGSDYGPVVWSGTPWASPVASGYPWHGLEPKAGIYGGTASIMFSPQGEASVYQDVRIEKNWINGGAVGLNVAWGAQTMPSFRVVGNRWGRDFSGGMGGRGVANASQTIIKPSAMHFGELSGNVYEDTGEVFDRGVGSGIWP